MKWPFDRSTTFQIACLVIVLVVVFGVRRGREVALWIGRAEFDLEFRVFDDASGQPVGGAAIVLQDLDYVNKKPKSPYHIELTSGPDGRAQVPLVLHCKGSTELDTGRGLSRGVDYPFWQIDVRADGYHAFTASFDVDYRKRDRRFDRNHVPPPVVIRLHREANHLRCLEPARENRCWETPILARGAHNRRAYDSDTLLSGTITNAVEWQAHGFA